jgi:hypothetical protein
MKKGYLRLVTPATRNRTVTPKRLPNTALRTREYLAEAEVERLLEAAKGNRWDHRDAAMIFVAYRHGLQASPPQAAGPVQLPPATLARLETARRRKPTAASTC